MEDCRERIMSQNYSEILVDYLLDIEGNRLDQIDYCYQKLEKDLGILYVDQRYTSPLSLSMYRYTYLPKCYGLLELNGSAYEESGVQTLASPPMNLTGKEVLIGFLDTGIRAGLPIFQNEDMRQRVVSLWDQTATDGELPPGFLYGSELLGDSPYLERLKADNPEAKMLINEENKTGNYDENGHGSVVASIAANAARDAYLVMVKLREAKSYLRSYYEIGEEADCYSETDILAGICYLKNISNRLRLPLVICMTLGTNMGAHEGDSILDDYLKRLGNKSGIVVVAGGGNEGNEAHHYYAKFGDNRAEITDELEIRVGEGNGGFAMELWGDFPNTYTVSITSPSGEVIERVPLRYGQPLSFRFVYHKTKVMLDYVFLERANSKQLILLRFHDPVPGIWTVTVYIKQDETRAEFHAWLPMSPFLSREVYFLRPNPFTTMTEPAFVKQALSVTYYDSENNSFAISSGRGYENEKVYSAPKPDVCAPGMKIDTPFGKYSGSSMAAALSAGAAAQLLEWAVTRGYDPLMNSSGAKNYFIKGAKRENGKKYPSPMWGYGKLDAEGIFRMMR